MQNMILYCLDNSDAACRSEDYPCGNRLGFQLNFVRTVSRSVLAPQQGQQTESISNAQLALVSSAGRPHLSVAPTTNAGALLGLDPDLTRLDGERCQFLGALRLALLAVKRSPTARVLAFLASQADLPAEQCRQLSRSFAEAGVPLDVVVLCPTDELQTELLASLELLTAAPVYEQPSTAGPTTGPQRPGPRRPGAPGARAPAAAIDQGAAAAGARQPAASIAAAAAAAATGGGSQAPGAGQAAAAAPPRGQRLLHFPPPDPSMALWQQMEPLLELLQIEGQPGGLEPGAEPGAAVPEDDRGIPSQLRTGRPPLPRPPRSAGAGAAASSSGPGQRPPGLAPSGPLPNRSSTRGGAAGTCRYESLDSLQHLSLDGFLRSWLPSYANYSRVLQVPTAQQQQQQGGDGGGGGASAGLGPGRLCYISVYRLQLPRWHKLCEVHAGCMYDTEGALEGAGPSPSPSASASGAGGASGTEVSAAAAAGATAASAPAGPAPTSTSCLGGAVAAATAAAAQPSALPAAARSAVVVLRAPCPVQVLFSTRCSSAAAAVASSSSSFVAAADGGGAARCRWVCADPRRGSLSLVASVEDPGVVKLLWSERQQLSAAQQPQYGSIFASAEDSGDGGVEPTAAELELTLSPTRTQFRVVPHVKGGAVLEVLSPRSVVHRPRQSPGNSAAGPASSSSHQAAGPAQAGPAQAASSQPSSQQQLQHRYFFWLQQDWSAEGAAEAAAAVPESRRAASIAEGFSEDGESGGDGAGERGAVPLPLPDRGCRALADHLQALLECPPEFDAHKHGNRVRCSSTPLQLGPLPFALIEEILRASGRQLHPDGTLALAATTSTIATAAAAAAAAATAAAASSPSAAAARLQQPLPQQQRPASGSAGAGSAGGVGGGAAGGAAGGESRRGPAGDVVALRREQRAAPGAQRGDGADGLCSLVMSGSPGTSAGVGPNAAAAAPHRRFSAAAAACAAAGAAPPWARSTRTSERRDIVQGFSRTTYSRPAAAPSAAAAPAASTVAAAAAEKGQGQATLRAAAWQAAAKALCSHPLADDFDDGSDWGSDCDSPAAGTSVESSAAPTPRAGFYAGNVQAACQGGAMAAGPSRDDASSAAASPLGSSATASPGAERTPTEAACLPGGCTRGGLAAAAAVAAAAAAVGSSGPSLVTAAVEPEGGGSCPEDSSLMFELD